MATLGVTHNRSIQIVVLNRQFIKLYDIPDDNTVLEQPCAAFGSEFQTNYDMNSSIRNLT